MEIVDSHFHLWDTADLEYDLFRDHPQLSGSFRLAQYEIEARADGVTGAICVEAASAGADGVLETEWLLRETEGSDIAKGIVAWAPLDDPKRIDAHLNWLQARGGQKIVGVRRSFEWEPDDFPRRREVTDGCRAAGERGLVVDLVMFSRSLRDDRPRRRMSGNTVRTRSSRQAADSRRSAESVACGTDRAGSVFECRMQTLWHHYRG